MEKFYIVTNEKYIESCNTIKKMRDAQRKFINEIFDELGIGGDTYVLGGDGSVNQPFIEHWKSDIRLRIENTEENMSKFGKELLSGADQFNLVRFRKNSKTMKTIQQRCIDEKVIINIHDPRIGDYFKELRMGGYSYREFEHNDKRYMSVSSSKIGMDTVVDGFNEIPGSEFYVALESFNSKLG